MPSILPSAYLRRCPMGFVLLYSLDSGQGQVRREAAVLFLRWHKSFRRELLIYTGSSVTPFPNKVVLATPIHLPGQTVNKL